jgi:hypothetical protein
MEKLKAAYETFILLEKGEIKNIGYKTNIIGLDGFGNTIRLTKICFNYSTKKEDFFYFNSQGKCLFYYVSSNRPEYIFKAYKNCLSNIEITPDLFIEFITEIYVKVELGFFS